MRSNTWRALILFSLTLMLVSTAMDAQAARRSSLAGNQFIDDADDMFAFPQLTHRYKNRIIVDMAPGPTSTDPETGEEFTGTNSGSGTVVFGDNLVWNFNTGRSTFLNNTAMWAWGRGDRFSGFQMNGVPGSMNSTGETIYEWWDVGLATHFGDMPVGFNVSWGTNGHKVTAADGQVTTEENTGMISLQAGATLGAFDFAGEFGFGSHKDKAASTEDDDLGYMNISLLARGDIGNFAGQDWRIIWAGTYGSTDPKSGTMEKLSSMGTRASVGPVWGTPGEWEVAASLDFMWISHDSGAEDDSGQDIENQKDENTYVAFPGYNLAMEYYLNSWLVARGGVISRNGAWGKKEAQDNTGAQTEDVKWQDTFGWTFGLGVDKGNWGLDLALEEGDVHSGYLPFNGDVSDDPIAFMTAWLAW